MSNSLEDKIEMLEKRAEKSQDAHDYYKENRYDRRISKTHERINDVLNVMNEGRLTIGEAKEMINMYSGDIEACLEQKKTENEQSTIKQ